MKIRNVAAAVSAAALVGSMGFVLPVSAETASEIVSPTWDIQLRYNNTSYKENGNDSIEVNSRSDLDMCGGLYFDIPAKSGKMITSATLRLVTERRRTTTPIGIYELTASDWASNGNATYDGLKVSSVGDPVASFTPTRPASCDKALGYDVVDSPYNDVTLWTDNISLATANIKQGEGYAITVKNTESEDKQYKFFTKDIAGIRYAGKDATGEYDVTTDALKPQLTLVYEDIAAAIGETNYSSLDAAITAANASDTDVVIELKKNDTQNVKLNPDHNVVINGNGHTITGSGTLYDAKPNSSKTITINNAILNISGTSASAPAFATGWKSGSEITINNTTVNADYVIYSTNDSTLKVTGNSTINGTVYLYVGSYAAETNKHRTFMNLADYTGGSINVKLIYVNNESGNHSNYAVGDYIINKANAGKLAKINFIDDTYELELNPNNNGDIILKEKTAPTVTKYFSVQAENAVSYDTAKIKVNGESDYRTTEIKTPIVATGTVLYFGIQGTQTDIESIKEFAIEGTKLSD